MQNNGNVKQVANQRDDGRTLNYTYDELNRVDLAYTNANSGPNCWGLNHSYDIWANLLTASVTKCSAPMLNVGVNTNNRITNSGFSYDAAGNLLADGSYTYQWNAESMMKSINSGSVAYTYDGDGKRVQKSNGKLYWYGVGSDPLVESDLNGNITDEYIFFGGKRIARRQLSGTIHYYFADHLGTSRVVTNATGAPLDDSDFYPFGGERAVVASTDNAYLFTGKERDAESGLDEFGARYYSSALGRFTIPDWSSAASPVPYADFTDPQSLNLYGYVRNNALSRTDPDGHCTVDGEKHGWLWCAAHKLGITQTQKEQADQARKDLSGLKNVTINGQAPQDFAENATNQQAIAAKRAVTEFLVGKALESLNPCPPSMSCAVIPLVRGSTGRVVAANLKEQLAMEQAMSRPAAGKPLKNVMMADRRWPASGG